MSQETILVVEDETITALDIQQGLQRKGYRVPAIACSGLEAIELARQSRPDLVLMDIRLKGAMDGIEAAERIRQERNTPVVFLTAYADCATLERAKRAEPFAYLLKPFEEAVLATTIEIALHKHQAQELLLQEGAEALHLSQERFRCLAENVAEYAVVLLDATGRIFSWSAGAEQIHGWCAGEVLGKHFSLLYPAEEIAQRKPEQDLETALQAGRHLQYGSQMRKDASRFAAHMIQVPLQDTGGSVAGYLQVSREVSPGGNHN
ncbi:MAG TPA: response regulator [Candidatus Sulfotelmatobacter sp.]|nr:response regulator [Candidatus Sulfotelmatobacter sp.]